MAKRKAAKLKPCPFVERIIAAANLMSNLCFNWKQNDERFSLREREEMGKMQMEYDTARLAYRRRHTRAKAR